MNGADFWYELLFILVAGYLATDIWRLAGVVAATGVDENSEIFKWVRAVSTALVAALVARIIFFPVGALAEVLPLYRYAAVAAGLGVFFLLNRSIAYGIIAGEIVLLAGHIFIGS